jgi:hypothetical protein
VVEAELKSICACEGCGLTDREFAGKELLELRWRPHAMVAQADGNGRGFLSDLVCPMAPLCHIRNSSVDPRIGNVVNRARDEIIVNIGSGHRGQSRVLILAGAEDHFIPFHQAADFEKSLINARSVTTRIFDRPSGGAAHCQGGNTALVHAAVFDWLLEKFPGDSQV